MSLPSPQNSPPDIPTLAATLLGDPAQRFFNRELSWLKFNRRVVEEAQNTRHPLLERVRFLSISASNLDEFFMVRVAGLNDHLISGNTRISMDGLSTDEQLTRILDKAQSLMQQQADCWLSLKKQLAEEHIHLLAQAELTHEDVAWLDAYFMANIFPTLTPMAIDPAHPFPFLPNKSLTALYELQSATRKKPMLAVLALPPKLPRFVLLPGTESRLVPLEVLIALFVPHIFPGYSLAASGLFRILRDSDLDIADEAEDLVRHYEQAVKERMRGHVIRLKVDRDMPEHLRHFLSKQLQVPERYIVETDGMLGLSSLSELCDLPRQDLKFLPFSPRYPERISDFQGDCFAAIRAKDIVVHHPYESFDVVVQFLRQAALDPNVISIKQTLYRTSNDSPIVRALIEAAEQGKSVTAVVELRARFDEEANIRLSRDMEHAGVQVVYGFVGLKTHAKVSLVTRRAATGLESYVHFGTGNYHPITAKVYTDLSFFTSNPTLCLDAAILFNYLTGYATPKSLKKLVIAPYNMRSNLLNLIAEEATNAREGKPAHIWAKLNSLVDEEIIDALYAASLDGVQIDLVVRGICCLRPEVKGLSDNIRVKSIVGRFLEHTRIFCFANGHPMPSRKAKVYISSADWMRRNLDHRVEYMAPLTNPTVHEQVLGQVMAAALEDDLQSWALEPDGTYQRMMVRDGGFSSHEYFMRNPSLSGRGKALKRGNKPPKLLSKS